MGDVVRIVHTGGFRLDEPVLAGGGLPVEIRNLLQETRFIAFRRICNAAIRERADLMLLAGELCDPSQDRRGLWHVHEQCRRLAQAGIDVIWAGRTKPPAEFAFDLLPNVRFVAADHAIGFRLSSRKAAVEVEWSHVAGEPQPHGQTAELAIRLQTAVPSMNDEDRCRECPAIAAVEYVVRGLSATTTVPVLDSPDEACSGGGCRTHVVEIDPTGQCSARELPIHVVRRVTEVVETDGLSTLADLRHRLRERLDAVAATESAELTIVDLVCTGAGDLWPSLADPGLIQDVLRKLREAATTPGRLVWPGGIACRPAPGVMEAWSRREDVAAGLEQLDDLTNPDGTLDLRRVHAVIPPPAWAHRPRSLPRDRVRPGVIRALAEVSQLPTSRPGDFATSRR